MSKAASRSASSGWVLRLRRVYAWSLTGFPNRATRFDFEQKA